MADPKDSNQTKDQKGPPEESLDGETADLISLDQLESMILSADPLFAEDLEKVRSLPVDKTIDLDIMDLEPTPASSKNKSWNDRLYFYRVRFRAFYRDLGPNLKLVAKEGIAKSINFVKDTVAAFKVLRWQLKLLALTLGLASVLTVVFVFRSFTHGVLPEEGALLMTSLEEWAEQTYKYDADAEMDSFYDSPRAIQNIMSLSKMIVNIRPSAGSGPNPMAAMEFFLEGMSPEAIVEVKDRESEIRDLFQRTMEEMTFDELAIAEGKQLLTERLRQALNANLTKGKVRRVFIKEAVIKP
ncbi:MAG: flagellar basal body-associated FliL family protein [Bdellovibrionaceae bacterium]|nr:flagellar basal body-associated FliL family protein [Pseudobdellovibrionaceae bacterium]